MKKGIYFKNLDGIRTVAALMVFFWHAYAPDVKKLPHGILKSLFLSVFNGENGVSIFFVLSGFLITYLILAEVKETNSFSLGRFYVRRVLRIWPLYFGLLVVAYFILLPILGRVSHINTPEIMAHSKYYFLFVSNFDIVNSNGAGSYLPVGITWSVAVEEQFYLVWPLLFFFVPASKYKYPLFITAAISLGFKIYHYADLDFLRYHSLSAMSNLAFGGIAAYYLINGKIPADNFFFRNRGLMYGTGFLVMFAENYFDFTGNFLVCKTIEAVFYCFVILDQNVNPVSTFKVSSIKWLDKLGKYTYGIYMIHMTVLYGVIIFCIAFNITGFVKHLLAFFVGLPVTVGLAYLSYEYFEKWFLRLKDRVGYKQPGSD